MTQACEHRVAQRCMRRREWRRGVVVGLQYVVVGGYGEEPI